MNYYFAYGSNMSQEQMKQRCPEATIVGRGLIKNYRIDFTRKSKTRNGGVADIIESNSDSVWGIIYKLTDNDFVSLDEYEGYPNYYNRKIIQCNQFVETNPKGSITEEPLEEFYSNLYSNPFNYKEIEVLVYYVVNKSATTIQPSIEYLHLIQSAAEENYFPTDYLEKLNAFAYRHSPK